MNAANTRLITDLKGILSDGLGPKKEPRTEELEESGNETAIMQHLALAAQSAGVDLDDRAALKAFVAQVKTVVTKDVAKLGATLRRFTAGKARETIRAAKASM
jgi:hypothetical protein